MRPCALPAGPHGLEDLLFITVDSRGNAPFAGLLHVQRSLIIFETEFTVVSSSLPRVTPCLVALSVPILVA